MIVAVAAVAGITVVMTASGSQRAHVSALGLGGGADGSPSIAAPASASVAASPTHNAAPSASPPTPSVTPSVTPLVTPLVTMPAGAPSPGRPGRGTPAPSTSPRPATPSASPSLSPSASPSQGRLLLAPDKLLLTSAKGKAASGFFVLTATDGPVGYYTIKVPAGVAGKVAVSPSAGSLPANGYVVVTVTVTSNAALSTDLTVEPGNLTVTVVYEIKAKT